MPAAEPCAKTPTLYGPESVPDKFWELFDKTPGCWLWKGPLSVEGRGTMSLRRKRLIAVRISYAAFVGPIEDGYVIHQKCREPLCVNPAHLESITNKESTRRGKSACGLNARKDTCGQGHPFTPENTRYVKKGRLCRACRGVRLCPCGNETCNVRCRECTVRLDENQMRFCKMGHKRSRGRAPCPTCTREEALIARIMRQPWGQPWVKVA